VSKPTTADSRVYSYDDNQAGANEQHSKAISELKVNQEKSISELKVSINTNATQLLASSHYSVRLGEHLLGYAETHDSVL